jgi:ketosteroid isomerase-like protein
MRRTQGVALAVLLTIAVLLTVCAAPTFSQAPGKTGASLEEELKRLDHKWLDAERTGDVAYCEQFFADSYVLVFPNGQMLTKDEWLGILKSANPPKLEVLSPDDIQVHLFGNVAILTDHTTIKGRDGQGNSMDGEYRVFRVVIKEKGKWRATGVVMNKL